MSEWQNFDPRKICPKCGDYQTRVEKKQRLSLTSTHVFVTVMGYVGIMILIVLMRFLPSLLVSNVYLLGLVFISLTCLVIVFVFQNYFRGKNETARKQFQESNWIGYSLRCLNCGYRWEMTIDEWETAERKEKENFIDYPPHLSSSKGNLDESFEKIEWKPPDRSRGIFIVIISGIALLLACLLAYGALWSLAHPNNPYAFVVDIIVMVFGLAYLGLILVFIYKVTNSKVIKSNIIKRIPFLGILLILMLILIAVRFLLK